MARRPTARQIKAAKGAFLATADDTAASRAKYVDYVLRYSKIMKKVAATSPLRGRKSPSSARSSGT